MVILCVLAKLQGHFDSEIGFFLRRTLVLWNNNCISTTLMRWRERKSGLAKKRRLPSVCFVVVLNSIGFVCVSDYQKKTKECVIQTRPCVGAKVVCVLCRPFLRLNGLNVGALRSSVDGTGGQGKEDQMTNTNKRLKVKTIKVTKLKWRTKGERNGHRARIWSINFPDSFPKLSLFNQMQGWRHPRPTSQEFVDIQDKKMALFDGKDHQKKKHNYDWFLIVPIYQNFDSFWRFKFENRLSLEANTRASGQGSKSAVSDHNTAEFVCRHVFNSCSNRPSLLVIDFVPNFDSF